MVRREQDWDVAFVVAEINADVVIVGRRIIVEAQLRDDGLKRPDARLDQLAPSDFEFSLIIVRLRANLETIDRALVERQSA